MLAALAALVHLQNHPGLFYPDTINFLREGLLSDERLYPVIPPAYPLILDAIRFFVPAPARMFVLVALQQLGFVLAVWCTVRIGAMARRPALGVIAGLLVAAYQPFYSYAQTSQSESLYVTYAAVACVFAVRGWTRDRSRDFAWAGLWTGLAIAQRSVGAAIPIALLLALWIGTGRARIVRTLLLVLPLAAVLGAFAGKNGLQHGHTVVVGGTGLHLFGRVAVIDKFLPDTPEANRVREVSAKHGSPDPLSENAGWRLQGWMQGDGVSAGDANALLTEVALQVHLAAPLRSLRRTLLAMASMVKVADAMGYMLWNGLRPERFQEHCEATANVWAGSNSLPLSAELLPYPGQPRLGVRVYDWLERWSALSVWARGIWVIPAMMLAWLLGALRRDACLLLLAGLPFVQLFLTAIGDQPFERYWDACVPPFVCSLVLACATVAEWWRARRARRSRDDVAVGAAAATTAPAAIGLAAETQPLVPPLAQPLTRPLAQPVVQPLAPPRQTP